VLAQMASLIELVPASMRFIRAQNYVDLLI